MRGSKPVPVDAEEPGRDSPTGRAAGAEAEGLATRESAGRENLAITELQESVARLAAERDQLRHELDRAHHRIASLERLADEDALTPVANRRAFVRQLNRMISFSHRYGVPASIVYFDVNNMKHINDTYGHPAGDAVLRHIASILHENVRASDVVGRLGGDEFGVVLAHTGEMLAHKKAVALADAIAQRPLRWEGSAIAVSAAFGVYAFAATDTPQHAIEAADRAMYEQKRASGHGEEQP